MFFPHTLEVGWAGLIQANFCQTILSATYPPIHEKASSAYVGVKKFNQDLGDHDPYLGNFKGTKGTNKQTATLIM